ICRSAVLIVIQNRIQPIEDTKKTVTAIVQERVRQAILDGLLIAGARIDQNQLANDLNVSLVPVREALKMLEGEGFVQIIPRRGAFVTQASMDDMHDLYFTRQILEGQAAYHAAPHLTDDHIARLNRLYDDMGEALAEHDYHGFMEFNRQFHFVIYNESRSRYLTNIIISLWDLAERYRYRYVFLKDQGEVIQREHRAIIAACEARDSKQLRDAIIYHMQRTLVGIQAYMANESRDQG
ncbi:MAG: GntR family transcriptional regulator, partial [Anaerolineae bacterium]|nr:GntR family transcriptional regulator [Anaerolineae bacterium]